MGLASIFLDLISWMLKEGCFFSFSLLFIYRNFSEQESSQNDLDLPWVAFNLVLFSCVIDLLFHHISGLKVLPIHQLFQSRNFLMLHNSLILLSSHPICWVVTTTLLVLQLQMLKVHHAKESQVHLFPLLPAVKFLEVTCPIPGMFQIQVVVCWFHLSLVEG